MSSEGLGARLAGLALTLALAASGVAAQAGPAVSCPPQATAPTPQQLQAAQARARDRGFLWRLSKDGRTHHLYGTIHVGRLDWAYPGPKLRAALADAQTLAFELDPLDPALQSSLRSAGSGRTPLPAALGDKLARALERACLPAQALAGMHPMMQAMTAMVVDAARDGLQVAYGQEFVLAAFARSRELRTVSLETPERQMAALIPDDAAQAERFLASTLEQLASGLGRKVLLRMAAAWERSDLQEIESYERWCDCVQTADDRALLAALNDARNPAMADRIEALHGAGQRLFIAVGALHMTGSLGLPKLLAARGFRVERVDFR
jgi:uncharacterized protein YbaP (TraB family)